MNINKAREMLGDDAKFASDKDVKRDLDAAELLKNLFFDYCKRGKFKQTKKE